MFLKFCLAVVLAEALAEIISTSYFFERVRLRVADRSAFLGVGINCGYCCSVWCGVASAFLVDLKGLLVNLDYVEPLIWGLVVHRTSNLFHEILSRIFARIPWKATMVIDTRLETKAPQNQMEKE